MTCLKLSDTEQTQMQIEDALTQDPTVYEYDSVYETLHPNEQKKKKSENPEDRKVSAATS